MQTFIAYRRVSTDKQGIQGLGMDAQLAAINAHASRNGHVIAEYVEVESGRNNARPQLAAALQHARLAGATLLIAKLDRLARNVAFVSTLMETGVDFVACDMPTANRLTIHILAAVAEHEAKMISDRTKAGLAAAKARGIKLGGKRASLTADISARGRRVSSDRRSVRARDFRARMLPIVDMARATGAASYAQIAAELNKRGFKAARGGEWTPIQVQRLYE